MTHARTGLGYLVATTLFVAATALFFHRLLHGFDTALIGPPEDNLNDLWNMFHVQTHPAFPFGGTLHSATIKVPQGTSLLFQDFAYPIDLAAAWARRASGAGLSMPMLVACENAALLATFPLGGLAAFALVRHLTRDTAGALVGGFAFAFSAVHTERALHHLGLASIEFLPLSLLFAIRYLDRGRPVDAGAAIVLRALNALCSWYYLIYDLYAVLFLYAVAALRERRWLVGRVARRAAVLAAGGAVLLAPLIEPMVVEAVSHPVFNAQDGAPVIFVIDLLSPVTFPPLHPLGGWTRGLFDRFAGNEWEGTAYLGLVACALVAVAWRWGRRDLGWLLSGTALFLLVAAGRRLHVAGLLTIGLPTALPTWLPFLRNARAPGHATIYAVLFFSMAVGTAWRAVLDRWPGRLARAALAPVAALLVLDAWPARIPTTPAVCTLADALIAASAPTDAVLDLPRNYLIGNVAMAAQPCHRHPIVTATLSREGAATLESTLPDDPAAQRPLLVQAGVRWVVIHGQVDGLAIPFTEGDRARYDVTYQPVWSDGATTLLRVR